MTNNTDIHKDIVVHLTFLIIATSVEKTRDFTEIELVILERTPIFIGTGFFKKILGFFNHFHIRKS